MIISRHMGAATPESVELGEAVIFQNLEDEVVILNMTTQQYYNLDDVGAQMWHLLVELHDPDAVVKKLRGVYDIDEDTLRRDVHLLVQKLVDAQLLKTVTAA